jgi:hypothetical protein
MEAATTFGRAIGTARRRQRYRIPEATALAELCLARLNDDQRYRTALEQIEALEAELARARAGGGH